MVAYSSGDFKNGLKVLIDGEPFSIVGSEFHKPGKGQAFNKLKLKNLKNGRVLEKTVKIGASLEAADVNIREMQYLYNDGQNWHFMDVETYDQLAAPIEIIEEMKDWLIEEANCNVTLWNGQVISVEPPNNIEVRVTKTEPGLKGDTAQGGVKPAEIASGAIIKVPLFIDEGELIRVDTRTGEYLSRVK
jgi:elongation factor P